jgi:tryptophan synthase alpha chain
MNTRIDQCFAGLKQRGEKGFIAYITAGDPDLETTAEHVRRLVRAGVDIIELGVPFSDPLADGRVNQESAARALEAGTTFDGVLKMVKALRQETEVPLLCYCYMNLLYAPGFERVVRKAVRAGVDGLLILDLPAEESHGYAEQLAAAGLNNVTLITPTTPSPRIAAIVQHASGFVYAVSRTGVTGMQSQLGDEAVDLLERARALTELPVALGFGISSPAQAAAAAQHADAVVVGSMIVQRLHEAGRSRAKLKAVERDVAAMVAAVKEVG